MRGIEENEGDGEERRGERDGGEEGEREGERGGGAIEDREQKRDGREKVKFVAQPGLLLMVDFIDEVRAFDNV